MTLATLLPETAARHELCVLCSHLIRICAPLQLPTVRWPPLKRPTHFHPACTLQRPSPFYRPLEPLLALPCPFGSACASRTLTGLRRTSPRSSQVYNIQNPYRFAKTLEHCPAAAPSCSRTSIHAIPFQSVLKSVFFPRNFIPRFTKTKITSLRVIPTMT